jgi:hypothetical protein
MGRQRSRRSRMWFRRAGESGGREVATMMKKAA